VTSFGAADVGHFRVVGTKGSLELDPAYEYVEGLTEYVRRQENLRVRHYGKHDQFAEELVYFSDCILHDREPEPSGLEGLADVRIAEALQRSIDSGPSVCRRSAAPNGCVHRSRSSARRTASPTSSAPNLPIREALLAAGHHEKRRR